MISQQIAFYLRSATGDQEDLSRQERILRKFVSQTVDFTGCPVSIYCDRHESGRAFGPELVRLTRDLESGVCGAVVITRLNRISRSGSDLMRFYDLAKKTGFRFISLNENVDSNHWPKTPCELRGEG